MRVCIVFLALMALSLALVPSPSALALSDEEMCKLRDALLSKLPTELQEPFTSKDQCRENYWALFKPRPAKEFMPADEFAHYRRAIKSGRCDDATRMLARRFPESHPKAPSILANDADYKAWRTRVVVSQFDDLALCHDLSKIRAAQSEIDRLNIAAPHYAGSMTAPFRSGNGDAPSPAYTRQFATQMIFLRHRRLRHPETVKTLLKLSTEGKAIRLHPEYEYLLALWLRSVGDRHPMVQSILDRPLDPARKAAAAKVLETGELGDLKEFAE